MVLKAQGCISAEHTINRNRWKQLWVRFIYHAWGLWVLKSNHDIDTRVVSKVVPFSSESDMIKMYDDSEGFQCVMNAPFCICVFAIKLAMYKFRYLTAYLQFEIPDKDFTSVLFSFLFYEIRLCHVIRRKMSTKSYLKSKSCTWIYVGEYVSEKN